MNKQSGFYCRIAELTDNFVVKNDFLVATSFRDYSVEQEYQNSLNKVAVSDISFLCKIEITGFDAATLVSEFFHKSYRRLAVRQFVQGVLSHLSSGKFTLYRLCENHFRFVGEVNCSDLLQAKIAELNLTAYTTHSTGKLNTIAVLGPQSSQLLQKISWTPPNQTRISQLDKNYFTIARLEKEYGTSIVVAKNDWGYEIFCGPCDAPVLWDLLAVVGVEFQIIPVGLKTLEKLAVFS